MFLPDDWRDLWFFHSVDYKDKDSICNNGLRPTYLIDVEEGGHFGKIEDGVNFVREYGDSVLFFTVTPYQAERFTGLDDVMTRFPLVEDIDPESIWEDETGFFGAITIPSRSIDVFDENCNTLKEDKYDDNSCWNKLCE